MKKERSENEEEKVFSTLFGNKDSKTQEAKSLMISKIFYPFQEFVIGLSTCLHGDNEKKLQWAFRVYDTEEKGYLLKDVRKK